MTLHRWRKAQPGPQPAREAGQPDRTRGGRDRIAELQLENSRLRRLVTDLLLENIKLEEAAMQPRLGRSIIIENRPGGGNIWHHRAMLEPGA